MAPLPADIIACRDCDLLQRLPAVPAGGTARCARCGLTLTFNRPDSLDRSTALSVAALIAFLLANVEPLLGDPSRDGRRPPRSSGESRRCGCRAK